MYVITDISAKMFTVIHFPEQDVWTPPFERRPFGRETFGRYLNIEL